MNPIILILYSLSGFLMKLSDDVYDEKHNKLIASIIGVFCGIAIAYLASHNLDAAYIFFGILIGSALSLKIDGIHHSITFLFFTIFFIIWGFGGTFLGSFNLITLAICIMAAFIDEIAHDNPKVYEVSNFLRVFFDYRFTMKIIILVLALFGFLDIWTFIYFIFFEIFYILGELVFGMYFSND